MKSGGWVGVARSIASIQPIERTLGPSAALVCVLLELSVQGTLWHFRRIASFPKLLDIGYILIFMFWLTMFRVSEWQAWADWNSAWVMGAVAAVFWASILFGQPIVRSLARDFTPAVEWDHAAFHRATKHATLLWAIGQSVPSHRTTYLKVGTAHGAFILMQSARTA